MTQDKNAMQKLTHHNTSTQHGLVISYFGNSVAVEADDGQIVPCHLRRNQALPVVGDRVAWQQETAESGVILEILPRTSELRRGDGRGKHKVIAANIDAIVIVMSPPPIFSEFLIDRYLIAAEILSIPAKIVINKMDLLTKSSKTELDKLVLPYQELDYPVIFSSTITPDGMEVLKDSLANQTSVLVGPSGVGKSSIIRMLSPENDIRIGEVSPKGAGKHTTTATRLYHLREGGALIDSPGVREFNLWHVSQQTLLQGFKEFQALNRGCKFRDCQHNREPHCGVKQAILDEQISPKRYESYQKLLQEIGSK